MNKLYFGDNLEILREMDDERVHLICTDPPFNSGRDYNTFIGDSLAQKKAFTDTWTYDTAAQDARTDIESQALTSDTYKALFENPDIINTLVRLPDAWRIRPTQKSERHFDSQQIRFLSG